MKNYIRDNPDKFPYIYDEDEDAIYRHLGRCPADMRSKFYIGKAIEKRKNTKNK
jgi:hypothetical protein